MKKNNNYIIIIVLLILLTIVQLVHRYKIQSNKENKSTNIIPETSNWTDSIVIENMDEALSDYNGTQSKEVIRDNINQLIISTIPEIKKVTNDKTIMEDIDYYNNNKSLIQKNGITTQEDFISISQEIKNYSNNEALIFKDAKLNKDEELEPNKYKMYLDLEYDRNTTLHFVCLLSQDTNEITYTSNSDVEKLFSKYSGNVTQIEFYNVINNLKDNARWIHDNTKLTSINSQRQFFEENKDKLNEMGIHNVDDFINISMQVSNNVEWSNNSDISCYNIDLESFEKVKDYDCVKVSFVYGYMEELILEVYLSSNESIQPTIIIKGESIENIEE